MVDSTDKTVRHYSLLYKLGLFETVNFIFSCRRLVGRTSGPHF